MTPEVKAKFTSKLKNDPAKFSGRRVKKAVRTDRLKLVMGGGPSICYRMSGTEQVVRVYSEAKTDPDLQELAAAAREWIENQGVHG